MTQREQLALPPAAPFEQPTVQDSQNTVPEQVVSARFVEPGVNNATDPNVITLGADDVIEGPTSDSVPYARESAQPKATEGNFFTGRSYGPGSVDSPGPSYDKPRGYGYASMESSGFTAAALTALNNLKHNRQKSAEQTATTNSSTPETIATPEKVLPEAYAVRLKRILGTTEKVNLEAYAHLPLQVLEYGCALASNARRMSDESGSKLPFKFDLPSPKDLEFLYNNDDEFRGKWPNSPQELLKRELETQVSDAKRDDLHGKLRKTGRYSEEELRKLNFASPDELDALLDVDPDSLHSMGKLAMDYLNADLERELSGGRRDNREKVLIGSRS